ncbi:MAG: winged helix-turn-helix transcriptional regulator [Bombella sp.]|nr:winged helix-turn-helix transcriptional regulator [Bombella sp.]
MTWCFCELCGNLTEYSAIRFNPVVVKKLKNKNAKLVPLTKKMISLGLERAKKLAEHYSEALSGKYGPHKASQMIARYGDLVEMRADCSVESFHEYIEPKMKLREHARHGDLAWTTRLAGSPTASPKPSKLYCEKHHPSRSASSRRAYQRDRRFIWEYRALMEQIWSHGFNNSTLSGWDIEEHAYVRREAYRQVKALRSPTSMLDDFLSKGTMTQAEIARQLGISRQAVSAAIKRRALKKRQESDR